MMPSLTACGAAWWTLNASHELLQCWSRPSTSPGRVWTRGVMLKRLVLAGRGVAREVDQHRKEQILLPVRQVAAGVPKQQQQLLRLLRLQAVGRRGLP